TRGRFTWPNPPPAPVWKTGIQHDEASFIDPSRSQWTSARTRPTSSTWTVSPAAPTTVAVSTPWVFGWAVARGGYYGMSALTARQACDRSSPYVPEISAEVTRRRLPVETSLFG